MQKKDNEEFKDAKEDDPGKKDHQDVIDTPFKFIDVFEHLSSRSVFHGDRATPFRLSLSQVV